MDLGSFPRRRYTQGPTPLHKAKRLSEALGGPTIYIKRDDLLGLAGGGNKTRKLEFFVADALNQRADTLITCGAVQSNHCRLTLAAAVVEGLQCRLVLKDRSPRAYDPGATGNNLLFRLLGVEGITLCPPDSDAADVMRELADGLVAEGRKPYVIPLGGSAPLGGLGYAAGAQELLAQGFEMGVRIQHVVCPNGSGGTHAGLLAGFCGTDVSVTGISVSGSREVREARTHVLAQRVVSLLGGRDTVARDEVVCLDDYVGEGYTLPTPEMIAAVEFVARTEGILLDPTYTGKAMAGLIDMVRKGHFRPSDNVVFMHTGGTPGLYAHASTFLGRAT